MILKAALVYLLEYLLRLSWRDLLHCSRIACEAMSIDTAHHWWKHLDPFHPCHDMNMNRIIQEVRKVSVRPGRQAFDFEMQRFYLRVQRTKRVG